LESLKAFFAALPADSGAAFVVIQHLAPAHESMLTEILSQYTRMPVVEAKDALPLEANRVYVIPPNQYLAIREGVLFLAKPVIQHGIRMPIDYFFRSLAENQQERAVGILFSGAGSDGTLGVRAIRGGGGLSMAQDPQTCQFPDLPRSALATGLVDIVLAPGDLPAALLSYLSYLRRGGQSDTNPETLTKPGGLADILSLMHARTGCDFRCYKKSTILRRIERRMGLHRIADLAGYFNFLREHSDEPGQLFKDLLINVTAFFRDPETYDELRLNVIAPLVAIRMPDEPVRVWVPGCSTGEEAYSLAICLIEEMAVAGKHGTVQIFATDIDEEALQSGRQGLYPENIATDVGSDRLSKFFIRKDQGYQVCEMLRNMVVFASQNLIIDPPFSKMDIVSCRNLMIYLDAETQSKLIQTFNFALNPGGYLFLGKSESVAGQNDLFETVSKKARLYRRLTPAHPLTLDSPILPGRRRVLPSVNSTMGRPQVASYPDLIRQALLTHFAAAVVLVDRKGQILQFYGQTGKYLDLPTAEPSLNLLDIAKKGLSRKLRAAMHKASDDRKLVVVETVPLTRETGAPGVRITVDPLVRRTPLAGSLPREPVLAGQAVPEETPPLLAVILEEIPGSASRGVIAPTGDESEKVVSLLEDELRTLQQDLQSTIEDVQASNEELRVANEEVISTNEELQSSNEELETSKEELQSVNEELTTVNSQLQEKIQRLDTAYSDMENFLTSTEIATLFLDSDLRIKRFTPAATRLMKLIPSDAGRPISDLSMNFIDYDLTSDARIVAAEAPATEREVRHADGSVYLVRVMPYRTSRGKVDGVVVTFIDVTRLHRAEQQTRLLATVVTDSNDAVILFGLDGAIQAWNRGAQMIYGWSEAEALTMNIRDIMPPERIPEFAELKRQLLAGESVSSSETQRRTKDGRLLTIWLTATAVPNEAGRVEAFATTERDITDRKIAEEDLRRLNNELEQRVEQQVAKVRQINASLEQRVAERTSELSETNSDLVRFNQVMVDRELRMIELKKEVNEFCKQIGQPPRYDLQFAVSKEKP